MKLKMSWKSSSRKRKRELIDRDRERYRKNKVHKVYIENGKLSINGGEIIHKPHTIGSWRSHYGIKQPYKVVLPNIGRSVVMTGTQVDTDAYNEYLKEAQDDIGRKLGILPEDVIIDDPAAKKTKEIDWKDFHKQYIIPTYYDDRSLISRRIAQGTGISLSRLEGTQKGVIVGSEIEERYKIYPPLPEIKHADLHDGAWTIRNVTIQKRSKSEYLGSWEDGLLGEVDKDIRAALKGFSVGYSGDGRVT